MRKLGLLLGAAALAVAFGATPSWALVDNTVYVDSENGTDSSTCGNQSIATPTTGPCATLNQALQNLPATGGNVFILNGGVFGPVYLTTAVSINGPAERAVIDWQSGAAPGCIHAAPGSCGLSTASYAVDLQGNGSTDTFKFKNLIINNNGGSNGALHVHSAFGVALTDVAIRGGPASATAPEMVLVDSSQGSQLQIYLHDTDVAFLKNGGGISVVPTGTTPVRMNFNNSEVHNATFGLQAISTGLTGTANIQILVDTTQFFSFNNSAVSVASAASANGAVVSMARSAIVNTGGAGLKVNGAGAGGVLYESVIIGNNSGVNIVGGGSVSTYQNNEITFNGVNCAVSGVTTPCSSALNPLSPN